MKFLALCLLGCVSATSGASQTPPPIIDGRVLVANQGSANASLIDLRTGTAQLIDVGTGPHETAISPDGTTGVVTIYGQQQAGNQLAVIDMRTARVVRTISLGEFTRPHGAVFLRGSNTRVVLTSESTQRIVLVDIAKGVVEGTVETGAMGSHMVAIPTDGKRAFTANIGSGSVSEIDLDSRALVRTIAVAPRVEGIAVTPDGASVWAGSNTAGTVSVIDTKSGQIAATLSGFSLPYRIAISANGRIAIVCDPQGDRIHVADVAERKVLWTLDGLGAPRGVSISPDASTAFVTLNGDRSLAVVDLARREVVRRIPVGVSPDGVAYGAKTP